MKRYGSSLIALALLTSLGGCITGELDEAGQLVARDDCKPKEECKPPEEPPKEPPDDTETRISVMTQNQYLGTDFTPVFNATAAGFQAAVNAAVAQIGATNFQLRSVLLALQVLGSNPEVIALQEVANVTLNGMNVPGSPIFRNHLADTLAAFTLLGLSYNNIAQIQTWSMTAPVTIEGTTGTFSITDSNVTFVRTGIPAVPVPYNVGCLSPPVGGGPGCLYTSFFSTTPVPGNTINVTRGYIGVDVLIDGELTRVINTRLENRFPVPTNPTTASFQSLQALQLILVAALTPPGTPVILAGDFESSPVDVPIGLIVPPYTLITLAGYRDTWLFNSVIRPEFTCCQDPGLTNLISLLSRRVDEIFINRTPISVDARVLGDEILVRILAGLWPSLHGSVVARIEY